MAETTAVYFGCWNEAGHFLWAPGRRSIYDYEVKKMVVPTASDLDGSRLLLPRPEKTGTGCITYLPAINRTILAWWGSPWDQRGAVNAAFITNGDLGGVAMWQRFARYFPELSAVIEQPTVDHEGRTPDTCPECHGTGKTVISKVIGVEDCPVCQPDLDEDEHLSHIGDQYERV